ncbi:MAG TPA: hypothetical protein VGF45_15160 [Polyangia bacterium]
MKPPGITTKLAGAAGGALALFSGALPAMAAETAPATLRETGLYRTGSAEVAPANLRFSPQYPLWSDGAEKDRWVHVPAGKTIDASRPDAWQFPVGTRFWKQFSVSGRKVETRLIERTGDGQWRFSAYVWNAAGTEATLAPAAGLATDVEVAPGKRYVVPGEIDCRACHEGRATPVLGFSALQLSPDRDPMAPHANAKPGDLDLPALAQRGLLRGLPAALLQRPPRIAAPSAIARAALGYLATNCGSCHNQEGPLAGLEMTLDPNPGAHAVLASTVGRASRYLPPGSVAAARVAAGAPHASVLVTRMRSRDPLVQMPPLGTQLLDVRGIALIERWVAELREVPPVPKPAHAGVSLASPTQKEIRP